MKLIKKFTHNDVEHTVEYSHTLSSPHTICFDGINCSVNNNTSEHVRYVTASAIADDTTFNIIVFQKTIFVLNNGIEVDSNRYIEPLTESLPKCFKRIDVVAFAPLVLLFVYLFIKHSTDSSFNVIDNAIISIISIFVCSQLCALLGRYFLVHPLKTPKLRRKLSVLSIIVTMVIAIAVLVIQYIAFPI